MHPYKCLIASCPLRPDEKSPQGGLAKPLRVTAVLSLGQALAQLRLSGLPYPASVLGG